MKRTLIAVSVISLLYGCAGIATYSIQPYETSAGLQACCKVTITNGKDIANVSAHFTKTGDDYTVDLIETGVVATAPIAANGATVSAVAGAGSDAAASVVKLTK
jgi:hypothetical protein